MKRKNEHSFNSLRTFIGARNFEVSKKFYAELEFEIKEIDSKMCLVKVNDNLMFYLQDYYVKDWVNNFMMFLELGNLEEFYHWVLKKELPLKFKGVRLSDIKEEDWGKEFFMHDPSGILWHFGNFND